MTKPSGKPERFQDYLETVMEGVKKITEEDRITKPSGTTPMDEATMASYRKYKNYKDYTCRVLVEGAGPRGEQLACLIREHLAILPRVEAMINSEPGGLNPVLSDDVTQDIPHARSPSHVVLVNTDYISRDLPAETSDVIVTVAVFRPYPFISMLQHFCGMPTTELSGFAEKVVDFVNKCPTNGIADYLRTRDFMMEAAIERMRQTYILPE
jgi:hypothetical protein